jgi:hypothetical protein
LSFASNYETASIRKVSDMEGFRRVYAHFIHEARGLMFKQRIEHTPRVGDGYVLCYPSNSKLILSGKEKINEQD